MPLIGIRAMSANELRAAVDAFAPEYVNDWDWWLSAPAARRPVVMGKILRRWQATRPQPMRRAMSEAEHSPPTSTTCSQTLNNQYEPSPDST